MVGIRRSVVTVALVVLAFGCGASTPEQTGPRDFKWAKPVSRPGLPNLHQIEEGLYRGAQPDPEGFIALREMGIKTVINLRRAHDDADDVGEAGLAGDTFELVKLPMDAFNVDENDVVAFLKLASDPTRRPLFFHCQAGADRTGTMSAAYRMVVEGWSAGDAIEEMTAGGYGFHEVWINLVGFLLEMDVKAVGAKLGQAVSSK